uniref:Uncharacterized protein n=1 Tax=Latimeria chalumnae TaxID=7897 RepID=H3ATB5_LATCH
SVIDGMSFQALSNCPFAELSAHVYASALQTGNESERIDVVFDTYKDMFIKTAKRANRGSDAGVHSNNVSKTKLIQFPAEDWKNSKGKKLGGKVMFVTCEKRCFRLTQESTEKVDDLKTTTQEEADTCILLHAKRIAADYKSIIVLADDTDVLVFCPVFNQCIDCNMYIGCGTKTRIRLIDVSKLAIAIGHGVCTALIGMHSYTGCDATCSNMRSEDEEDPTDRETSDDEDD